jgi:hypothetical protein
LFGLLGGVAGIALAAVMHQALPRFLPSNFPRVTEIAFDVRIQACAVLVSVIVGVLMRPAAGMECCARE